MQTQRETEIDRNFDYFQRSLGTFLDREAGRFALLRHRAIIGFFDRPSQAIRAGAERFDDGLYSIQEVTTEAVDLGSFVHALDQR